MKGLYDTLQLQLMSCNCANFQDLVNRAIVIDNKRKEMDKKRKWKGEASGSSSRPSPYPQQGFQPRNQGPANQWNQQRPHFQQRQQSHQKGNQQAPRPGN